MGIVITFYSYKGGVGRSMALANIGILLAKWGKKTLLIDWDLEAPGLENYFKSLLPDFDSVRNKNGLIDILHDKLDNESFDVKSIEWNNYLSNITFENNSNLFLLTSGKNDDKYTSKVKSFDFSSFYAKHEGGEFLEDLRTYWKTEYDYILIDSRTGLTDSSGICSIQMPDILMVLFTATDQGFRGTLNVVTKSRLKQQALIYDRLKLKVLPIATRFDNSELKLSEEWLSKFASDLTYTYQDFIFQSDNKSIEIEPIDILKKTKVPYISFYSYGEKLPVLEQGSDDPNSIGYAYETIAAILVNNFEQIEKLKDERDLYIKYAKGEEVFDYNYYQKLISDEQNAREKLELQLKIKEELVKKAEDDFKFQLETKQAMLDSQTEVAQLKNARKLRLVSVMISIISIVIVAFFIFNGKNDYLTSTNHNIKASNDFLIDSVYAGIPSKDINFAMRIKSLLYFVPFNSSINDVLNYEFPNKPQSITYDSLPVATECTGDSVKYYWRYLNQSTIKNAVYPFLKARNLSDKITNDSYVVYGFKDHKLVRISLRMFYNSSTFKDSLISSLIQGTSLPSSEYNKVFSNNLYYISGSSFTDFKTFEILICNQVGYNCCIHDWWHN